MTTRTGEVLHPPIEEPKLSHKPQLKRRTGRLTNAVIASVLSVASVAGLGGLAWTISQRTNDNYSSGPVPTEAQGGFPAPPTAIETNIPVSEKAINKIPLAEATKKYGGMFMSKILREPTSEFPYGCLFTINKATVVDIVKDNAEDAYWVALVLPGDTTKNVDSGIGSVTNYDGSITKLNNYNGFTAWIELRSNTASFFNGSTNGETGVNRIITNIKNGDAITVEVDLNQSDKKYTQMDLASLNLLNHNIGKPNTDRSDSSIKFTGDRVYIDTSNK